MTLRLKILVVMLAAIFLGGPGTVSAQSVLAGWGSPSVSGDTIISLVTCYPGSDIYELEGHTALRITSPEFDIAVNYGVFDFNSPNFLYRFVKGETDYMAVAMPWDYFLREYMSSGRRVEEQELNFDSSQKKRLIETVERNLRPENRVYRYNYVKDNCATRPLSAIEAGLGDSLSLAVPEFDGNVRPVTFREVMRHYHRNYPWYQFGIDLALGSGIDYPLSAREYAFAPVLLNRQLAGVKLADDSPLVGSAIIDNDVAPDAPVLGPTPWWQTPMAVCWAVFALLLAATIRDQMRQRVTRWVDALYFGILGLAGMLLAFLVFVSVHEATSPNYLIVWINPLCLVPMIFIWLKKCKIVLISYQIANFAAVFALLLLWPLLPQSANAAFLPLVLGDLLRSGNYISLNFKYLKISK